MKKHFILAMFFICCVIALFCLVGCGSNGANNDKDATPDKDKQPTTIELTLENYTKYFAINEEITEYNREDYTDKYGFKTAKVNQTTKYSIVQLKENIKFNNVIISLKTDSTYWSETEGKLYLAYDGSGSTTIRATYSGPPSSLYTMRYKITNIEGSITIK